MVRGPAGSYAAGMSVAPTHTAAALGAAEVVIRPSGEYDLATAPALWQTLTQACADRPDPEPTGPALSPPARPGPEPTGPTPSRPAHLVD